MAENIDREITKRLQIVQAVVDQNYQYLADQWDAWAIESEADLEKAAADAFKIQMDSLSDTAFRQSTIIFTIFYASFFALWSFTISLLDVTIHSIAGLLMTVSLASFGITLILSYWYAQKIIESAIEKVLPLSDTAFDIEAEGEPDSYRKAIKAHNQAVQSYTISHLVRVGRLTKLAIASAAIAILLFLAGFGVSIVSSIPVAASEDSPDYTLDDLAFMVGHWKGDEAMGGPEEGWLPPANGVMVGVFRWPSVRGRYVIELLTIAKEEDGVIFRFKHFDPDVTPWEKNRANTYRLTEVARGCAIFTGFENSDKVPATMQYCRLDAETLVFKGAAKDQPIAETDFVVTFTDIDVLRRRETE